MADEMSMARAQEIFNLMCTALDRRNWSYGKEPERLLVHMTVNGEDIPMQVLMLVDPDKENVSLLSPLPFKMSENNRVEGAIAACAASFGMADGSFDYDMSDGCITFRLVASYRGGTLSEGVIQYMISCSCAMVDKFNDRFLALEKGMISLEDFIKMD